MRGKRHFLALFALVALVSGSAGIAPLRPAHAEAKTVAVVDPQLRHILAQQTVLAEVIVTFWGDGAPTPAQVDVLRQAGITAGLLFRALPMAGVLASAAQVDSLAARSEVRSLYWNRPMQYENADATTLTGVRKLRTAPSFTAMNDGLPVSGKGIGVLINDGGVDGTHKDIEFGRHLVQNVAGATNLHAQSDLLPITYAENIPNTDSTGGHGTHVAGIVGGSGAMSNGKYEGVAPGASLVGYGSGAALLLLDTLTGFDYALSHQAEYGIRVVTNSWGNTADTGTAFDPNDPTNVATKKAYDRNIVVLFSAGNSGPSEGSITGNYKKAPWVITVAAGDKQGRLASFSSRGIRNLQGTVTMNGQSWTWEDRPTVTAPGVGIVSARVVAPVSSLGATDDTTISPAYLPFYTHMSGTSMAAPHVAGIVALMLDANPTLTPLQVKQILQETATNIPGGEAWDVGAGYVNAYAAVDRALHLRNYGKTVNIFRTFNSSVTVNRSLSAFTVNYDPLSLSSNRTSFTVPAGQSLLVAKAKAMGVQGQTGNPINLALIAPDGTQYSSGVSVLFALYPDRTVSVTSPMPGPWTLELRGIGTGTIAAPEAVSGTISMEQASTFGGLNDIGGYPGEVAIKLAVSKRLVDGDSLKNFRPTESLTRQDLATYLTMGTATRQWLPLNAPKTYGDVKDEDLPFVEAVSATGAALKDLSQTARGVMLPTGPGTFSPNQNIRRVDLAFSLIQSLGLEKEALARNGSSLTVLYGGARIPIDDALYIPAEFRGYVQLSLDLNVLNAYFFTTQGAYDLQPTVHATFKPRQTVTRGDYAVAITRYFHAYLTN